MVALFKGHREALAEFSAHLNEHWIQSVCQSCAAPYYKKSSKASVTCGAFTCEKGYEFLVSKPPQRRFVPAKQIADRFIDFFTERGYRNSPPVQLVGHSKRSIFTGTAGQIFDRAIFDGSQYDSQSYCVAQPVVRMRTSGIDGFLKAFVNVSLEQLDASISDHLSSFEDYLDFISSIGVYVGDLRVKVYEDDPDWGMGRFRSAVIGVFYDGLEIGVLNYFTDIPQRGRPFLRMSDVSFGLERLTWLVNRTPRFVDTVGPPLELLLRTPHRLLDAYRTVALILQSGVLPDRQSQAGGKLRGIFLADLDPIQPIRLDLTEFYYHWWAQFHEPKVQYNLLIRRWREQLARQLEERLGLVGISGHSPDDVIEKSIKRGIVDPRMLRGE